MVKILDKDFPQLGMTEEGIYYLKTRRQHPSKQYEIKSVRFQELLWLTQYIIANSPEPCFIRRFEIPALAHWIRCGAQKGEISPGEARNQSRFIRGIYDIIFQDVLAFLMLEAIKIRGELKIDPETDESTIAPITTLTEEQ